MKVATNTNFNELLQDSKLVLVDFWATWCGPCQAEIPHMAKVAGKYASSKDILCISISLDEDKDAWKKQITEEKPAWPQYILTDTGHAAVSGKYKINAIPRFIIVDKQGRLVALNAERPSSSGVYAQIESAVK